MGFLRIATLILLTASFAMPSEAKLFGPGGLFHLNRSTPATTDGKQGSVTISAVGDIMMGTNFPVNKLPADQGRSLFVASTSYLQAADLRFGNFEDSLYDGDPTADGKTPGENRWLFRTPVSFAPRLSEAGFNILSLANNHSRDFGREGAGSTKSVFKSLGLQFSSKDGEVGRFQINGLKIAVLATDFYPGNRSNTTPKRTFDEIRELKKTYDLVIVSSHAGGEGGAAEHVNPGPEMFMGENRGDSIGFAHGAIDAGADLIVMHGPHVPRAMEVYKKHLIAYSLGNFATTEGISIDGDAGLAPLLRVKLNAHGEFVNGQIASFIQTRGQGTVYDPSGRAFEKIRRLSLTDFSQTAPHFEEQGFISP